MQSQVAEPAHGQPGHDEPSALSVASMWLFSLPPAYFLYGFGVVPTSTLVVIWLGWLGVSFWVAETVPCRNANFMDVHIQSRVYLLALGPWLAAASYGMFLDLATWYIGAFLTLAALVAWVFHAFRSTT